MIANILTIRICPWVFRVQDRENTTTSIASTTTIASSTSSKLDAVVALPHVNEKA